MTPTRRLASFWIVAAAFFAVVAATNIPTALYPLYRSTFHLTPSASALAFSVYAFALIPALLMFGPLSDRFGRRWVIMLAVTLSLIASAIAIWGPGFTELLAARAMHGLSAGACTAAAGAAMFEYGVGVLPRSLVEAVVVASPTCGSAIGPLWGAWAVDLFGNRLVAAYVSFLPVLLICLAAMAFTSPVRTTRRGSDVDLRPTTSRTGKHLVASFLAVALACFLCWSIVGLFQSLMPDWILQTMRTDRLDVGVSGAVVVLLVSMMVQLTVRSWPPRTLQILSLGALVVTCGLFSLTVAHPGLPMILAVAVCTGVAHGSGFLAAVQGVNTLALAAMPHRHATLLSVLYVGNYLAMGLPILGIGVLADWVGLDAALYGFFAVVGVVAVAMLLCLAARGWGASRRR
ncbi:MAG: MFS transporter [Mycobacterium sp.]